MSGKHPKIKFSETEIRRLSGKTTNMYFRSVMQKVFREKWSHHLERLLSGDIATLDLCAENLSHNLDFFPLLHTVCLVTGQKFDLDEKDHAKAADAWLCWYEEHRGRLGWNVEMGAWQVK
ncbi:MAG: hypothetical protein HYY16_14480 [Planctomycetes bacterium]|nr:hypothetical protein [Planctomycetota bacterium]